jgi:hypothetical protein
MQVAAMAFSAFAVRASIFAYLQMPVQEVRPLHPRLRQGK